MTDSILPKIHNEGYKFIVIFILVTIILYFIHGFLGFIGLVLTIWCYYFFRDPERISIGDDNYLTSPADGVVLQVMETNGPKELNLENKKFTKISIFMNVFDCHVNRAPCSGIIEEIKYIPGKFFNASLDKASEDNERNYYKIKSSKGEEIIVVQIAGLIARRIKCELTENDSVKIGQRYGLIRFGSRVDVYFPKNFNILVNKGQTSISGETVIADFNLTKSK